MPTFHQFSFRNFQNPLGRLVFPVCLALTLMLAGGAGAQAAIYYVSTAGSDSNAGTTLDLPFRTIQEAANLMRAGDTCLIRAGTYRETITPANSGASGAPITFDAYNNELVIISGANIVSGFTPYQESIYQAAMPSSMGKGKDQVFMGGAVQPEARFPNTPSASVISYPASNLGPLWPALGNFSVPYGTTNLVTGALLNGQPAGLWTGASYLGIHRQGYQIQTADITNSASGSLTVVPADLKKWNNGDNYGRPEYGRGYISGVLAALDAPGEWVWKSGTLYLRTPQGQDPNSITIEAKARQLAFDLSGKSYITIRKLEIVGASLNMHGASYIQVDGAKASFVSQYTRPYGIGGTIPVSQRGEAGIFFGGDHNTVKNSIIANSSGACLFVTGRDHLITNNIIRDCGYSSSWTNAGIMISPDTILEAGTADRGGHEISLNTIYNSGRASISIMRDPFYFIDTGRGFPTPFRKIRIVNNEIYNANLLALDSGLFYTHGTDGGGTEIAYNVIHDEFEPGEFGDGVYLDNYTWNYNTHHNLLWLGREGGRRGAFRANQPGGTIVVSNSPSPATWPVPASIYVGGPRIFSNNTYKYDYRCGVAGLTAADFPGGQPFAFGANLSVPATMAPPPTSLPDVIVTSLSHANGIFTATVKNQGSAGTPVGMTVGYFVDSVYKTTGCP